MVRIHVLSLLMSSSWHWWLQQQLLAVPHYVSRKKPAPFAWLPPQLSYPPELGSNYIISSASVLRLPTLQMRPSIPRTSPRKQKSRRTEFLKITRSYCLTSAACVKVFALFLKGGLIETVVNCSQISISRFLPEQLSKSMILHCSRNASDYSFELVKDHFKLKKKKEKNGLSGKVKP